MPATLHASATHPPWFVTGPGESDVLMTVMAAILLVSVLGFGILFLRLHTLPERIAHKRRKLQFELVAVLGLISLFTHIHLFWIAGLILALIELPDIGGWLKRITEAVERIAGTRLGRELSSEQSSDLAKKSEETSVLKEKSEDAGELKNLGPEKPAPEPAKQTEAIHA